MKTRSMTTKKAFNQALLAATRVYGPLAVIMAATLNTGAFAVTNIQQISDFIHTELQSVGRLLVALSYVAAFGVGGLGAWKLYQASKQQGQTTYKEAGMMLLVAGLLAVITTVVGAASGTIFNGQQGAPSMEQPSFS